MRRKQTRLSAALAAAALAIAGCGSGSELGGGATAGGASNTPRQLAFAQCMRAHRVTGFPDPGGAKPSGSGVSILGIALPPTIDIKSPAFQAALSTCQKLATGGAPQGGVAEAEKQAALRFSQCMRAHGAKNYPDPVFRNGRIGVSAGDTNPNSPAFLAAEKACGNP